MTSELQHTLSQTVSLLNKGIDHIPQAMNILLKQYAHQQLFYGIANIVVAIIVSFIVYRTLRPVKKLNDEVDEYDVPVVPIFLSVGSVVGAVIIVCCVFEGIDDIGNALFPLMGLIQSLK